MASKRSRRQLAIRRLLLDGKGKLTPDAMVLIADMRNFCHAGGKPLLLYSPQSGMLDPLATVAATARREVFDRYMRLLNVDEVEILNVKDDGL